MKFAVSSELQNNVVFHAKIDEDGDLMLYANEHKLLFVSHRDGRVHRMSLADEGCKTLPGFEFNDDGRVELSS
jgi:hypothetical protein